MKAVLLSFFLMSLVSLSAKLPAQFWGNYHGGWRKALSDLAVPSIVNAPTPALPQYPATRLAVWSDISDYKGKVFGPSEVQRLRDYVSQGGVLILYGTVPCAVFKDLPTAAPVLGARLYNCTKLNPKLTDLGRKVLGDTAIAGDIYTNFNHYHPSMEKLCGLQVLFGTKDRAELAVNRIGKGAVIYCSGGYMWGFNSKQEVPYGRMLNRLVRTVLDPQLLDRFFPPLQGNNAAKVGKTLLNLTIEGVNQPAFFLEKKLREITGKPITPCYSGEQFTIHVGETDYAKSLNLDLKSLHPFGYVMICRDGRNLVLAGRTETANFFAVNDFLKRYAGYRKFGELSLLEVIPSRPCLVLPAKLELREEPDVNSYNLAGNGSNKTFGRSNRLNAMATHALDQVVSPKLYAKTHPEYFPMIEGKRMAMKDQGNGPWNPCMSNPDLPRLVEIYADAYFKKNPDRLCLPLGVNDGGGDCMCPKCQELVRKTGNQYVEFYNMAARVVAKKHPGKLVAFIAYSKAKFPPHDITMEPNVLVETIGFMSLGKNKMEAWKKVGVKHFGLYDYIPATGWSKVVPQFYPHILGKLWKDLHRTYHLRSLWMEWYPQAELLDAPRQYVLDELAWNMDADIDALLDDYYDSMFQQAAPELKNFFTILETCFARTLDFKIDDGYYGVRYDAKAFTRDDLNQLQQLLKQAKRKPLPPIVIQRIDMMAKFFQIIGYHVLNRICAEDLKHCTDIKTLEDCRRLVAIAAEGYDAQDKLRKFTLTPQEEKMIFIKDGLKEFTASTIAPGPILEEAVDPAFQRIAACLQNHGHDVDAFFRREAEKTNLPPLQAALNTQLYLRKHTPENLVRNPSFEDVGPNTTKGLASDHVRLKDVPCWTTWTFGTTYTRFEVSTKEAHTGKRAAFIHENDLSGLLHYVALKRNCRYRLSLWAKRNAGNIAFKGCGGVGVRLQQPSRWLDKGASITIHFTPECQGKWVRYETTFTAPDLDDVTALLILNAPQQTADIWTAYDDVSVQLIYDPQETFTSEKTMLELNAPETSNLPQLKTALETARDCIALANANLPRLTVNLLLQDKGPDGVFDFKADGQNITITGSEEGLRCGLYTLLNHLGFHWFSPAEDMVYPRTPVNPDLTKLNGLHTPHFSYRGLHVCAGSHHYDDTVGRWMSFNRMNRKLTHLPEIEILGKRLTELGLKPDTTVHAYSEFIREKDYFKDHPEYFSLIGGKRTPYSRGGQLCLSNQKMRDDFTKELLAIIRSNPTLGVIGICPEDGYGHCECPECMALDTQHDRDNKLINGRIANFVQDICARIKKAEPKAMLGHYSYSNFANFMELIPNAPDNLLVSFTQFHCYRHPIADHSCTTNQRLCKTFEHLCSKVKHVYLYDYYGYCWQNLPAPYWPIQYKDFKYWKACGVDGFLTEASGHDSPSWQSFWPALYYAARLLWNSDYPSDQLIQDFCQARYGKAAPHMTTYFLALQQAMLDLKTCFLKEPQNFNDLFTPEVQNTCANAINQAQQLEPDNQLLRKERKLFDFWRQNSKERILYQTDMTITAQPMGKLDAKPQRINLVNCATLLPDKTNNTTVTVMADQRNIRILMDMKESNMSGIVSDDKSPYHGDCIELFFDDGNNPQLCYHFLISPNGGVTASSCKGSIWNWNWKHQAIVKGQRFQDRWTLDFTLPKADINAGKTFGFNVVRNRCAGKKWEIVGAPNGGAYFKVKNYIQVTTPEP